MPLLSSSSHGKRCFPSIDVSDDSLLLCSEDAGAFSEDGRCNEVEKLDGAPDPDALLFPVLNEEERAMEVLTKEESRCPHPSQLLIDRSEWSRSVDWILKVSMYYHFSSLTPYRAVVYMNRFLSTHQLPQPGGWPMQLLSVACLSLAAKLEETLVPSLLDLQVEDARFVFDPRTICKMELLILTALDWRIRSVTPFDFLDLFIRKIDVGSKPAGCLASRASRVILLTIRDTKVFEYRPSTIAAAAVICVSFTRPDEAAVSWYPGFTKDELVNCHQLMRELVLEDEQQKRRPRKQPQLRVTSKNGMTREVYSSSSTTQSPCKRRKLNNFLLVEDDKKVT